MYIYSIIPLKWDFRTLLHINFNIHLTRNMSFIGTFNSEMNMHIYIDMDLIEILPLHMSILVFRTLYITSTCAYIRIHMSIYVFRSNVHSNYTFNKMMSNLKCKCQNVTSKIYSSKSSQNRAFSAFLESVFRWQYSCFSRKSKSRSSHLPCKVIFIHTFPISIMKSR